MCDEDDNGCDNGGDDHLDDNDSDDHGVSAGPSHHLLSPLPHGRSVSPSGTSATVSCCTLCVCFWERVLGVGGWGGYHSCPKGVSV